MALSYNRPIKELLKGYTNQVFYVLLLACLLVSHFPNDVQNNVDPNVNANIYIHICVSNVAASGGPLTFCCTSCRVLHAAGVRV